LITWYTALTREKSNAVLTPFTAAVDPSAVGLMSSAECSLSFRDTGFMPDYSVTIRSEDPVVTRGDQLQKAVMTYFHMTEGPIKKKAREQMVDERCERLKASVYTEIQTRMKILVPEGLKFTSHKTLRLIAKNGVNNFILAGNKNFVGAFKGIDCGDDAYNDVYSQLPTLDVLSQFHAFNSQVRMNQFPKTAYAKISYDLKDVQEARDLRKIADLGERGKEPFDVFTLKWKTSPIKKFVVPMIDILPYVKKWVAFGHSAKNNWETLLRVFHVKMQSGLLEEYDFESLDDDADVPDLDHVVLPEKVPVSESLPQYKGVLAEEMQYERALLDAQYVRFGEATDEWCRSVPTTLTSKKYDKQEASDDKGQARQALREKEVSEYKDLKDAERNKLGENIGKYPVVVSDVYLSPNFRTLAKTDTGKTDKHDVATFYWACLKNVVVAGNILIVKWVSQNPHGSVKTTIRFDWEAYMLANFKDYMYKPYYESRMHNGEIIFAIFPKTCTVIPSGTYPVTIERIRNEAANLQCRMAWGNDVRTLLLAHGVTQTAFTSGLGKFALRFLNNDVIQRWQKSYVSSLSDEGALDDQVTAKIESLAVRGQAMIANKTTNLDKDNKKVDPKVQVGVKEEKLRKMGVSVGITSSESQGRRLRKLHLAKK